jgi:hypothetical protein
LYSWSWPVWTIVGPILNNFPFESVQFKKNLILIPADDLAQNLWLEVGQTARANWRQDHGQNSSKPKPHSISGRALLDCMKELSQVLWMLTDQCVMDWASESAQPNCWHFQTHRWNYCVN